MVDFFLNTDSKRQIRTVWSHTEYSIIKPSVKDRAPDPVKGPEIQKTRPCLVISSDEMNHAISTVIVAPMTTKSHPFPTRVAVDFDEKKAGKFWIKSEP